MSYKKLVSCLYLSDEKAVKGLQDRNIIEGQEPVALAEQYNNNGADELLVFDLSCNDEEHEAHIGLLRQICRSVSVPVIAGGHVERLEDVKKLLYAGVDKALLNFSKPGAAELLKEANARFGKDKLAVSISDVDSLFKHRKELEEFCDGILLVKALDHNSIDSLVTMPCLMMADVDNVEEMAKLLKMEMVTGLACTYTNRPDADFVNVKALCKEHGISMNSFESELDFEEFKLNSDGLIPVITQDYKTGEVLMLAYMNRESFEKTVQTGRMTYYSRSRQELWVKGLTSGHFQYVRSLTLDCDKDTILAKVQQIGAACHTGNKTCFFTHLAGKDTDEKNPLEIFQEVYETILDRKAHPKEGSYTNYLFEKGIDKILKKVGEEATEIVIAAKNPDPEEIKYEISDFLYHTMVLMVERGVTWEDIIEELSNR